MQQLLRSIPRRHGRCSAVYSTRKEWQEQVLQGPELEDFIAQTRHKSTDSITPYSEKESVHQIFRILAHIRQLPMEQDKTRSPQLIDQYGRLHTYLRISLTERCNLRCRYCMPENGVPLQPVADLLTSCEIIQATKLLARSGITRIRLTGGEPLLRRDLIELVTQLKAIQGIQSIGITTNGMTLERKLVALQRAGIDRVNISLDTLNPDNFRHITRRQGFTKVMKSIEEAQALGFHPLKINCVVQRHFNLDELVEFVAFTEKHAVDVRFIEWMPFDSNEWNDKAFVSYQEMIKIIQTEFHVIEKLQDQVNDTSKAYHVPGFRGQFGFITSMSEHFCGSCNRLRLTADGNLKVCLFGNTEVSLRDAMRYNIADEDICAIIDVAVKRKKFALGGHGDMYGLSKAKNRPMILIGG